MKAESAISVKGLSKAYRIWDRPSSRLLSPSLEATASIFPAKSGIRRSLQDRAESHYHDFVALSNVSFELKRGESLGIIGRNGSGKSTLLQIIAGTLQSTEGTVSINGRIAALLELGSGFNPDFTGRENVYLNAAVLGLTREETDARFDQIAAFADIGEFIEQPVSTYSSGMMVRLAFAVSISVEPDILIVDESWNRAHPFSLSRTISARYRTFAHERFSCATGMSLMRVHRKPAGAATSLSARIAVRVFRTTREHRWTMG
jgi:ABC-type polysaccharide/polyol phosphate transport system ATPase subunit